MIQLNQKCCGRLTAVSVTDSRSHFDLLKYSALKFNLIFMATPREGLMPRIATASLLPLKVNRHYPTYLLFWHAHSCLFLIKSRCFFFPWMFNLEASNQTLITLFACFDDQLVCATWSQNVNQGENVAQIEVCRLIMYCASVLWH